MGLFKMRPARQQVDPTEVILDLDKLISEPQTFRWRGKLHKIKPISTKTFFQLSQKIYALEVSRASGMDEAGYVKAYHDIFSLVCDTLKTQDLENMEPPQMGALMQFILDCMKGRAQGDGYAEKKKTLAMSLAKAQE